MNLKYPQRRESGFTLIELLVVIAIIAILAAILFPVFAQAREKARQASCISNLKQVGTAFMMYAQDYDEMYPVWNGTAGQPGSYWPYWNYGVDPYIKGQTGSLDRKGIWVCPSAPKLNTANMTYGYNYLKLGYVYTGANAYLRAHGSPASMAAVEEPASTIMVAEGLEFIRPPYWVQSNPSTDVLTAPHHHSGKLNYYGANKIPMAQDLDGLTTVAWADGHVKPMKRRMLVPPSVGGSACSDDLWGLQKGVYKITAAGCP